MRRGLILLCFAMVGCVGMNKPMPRWLVLSDPRVEVALGQSTATAVVGDSVYIDVGRAVLDPDTKGYTVTVDGRKLAHPEWDTKDADLRFRYRTKTVGEHIIEITIPQPDAEPIRRGFVVNVIE